MKRLFYSIWIAALFILPNICVAGSGTQVWNDFSEKHTINDSDDFTLFGGYRFRDNFREFWYGEVGGGLTHQLGSGFSVAPTFSVLRLQPANQIMTTEYRPALDLGWKSPLFGGAFSFRARNELRIRHFDEDISTTEEGRFRFRAMQTLPLSTEYEMFVSEEMLYGEATGTWQQSRFFLGVSLPKIDDVLPQIAWGVFSDRRGRSASFADSQVIALALKF